MTTVSLEEAATRLRVSQETIRPRVHRGELPATQAPTPQGFPWLVDIPGPAPAPALEAIAHDPRENGTLDSLVATLRAQVQTQQDQLTVKDRQISELQVLLQQTHQLALPSPKVRPGLLKRFWYRIMG